MSNDNKKPQKVLCDMRVDAVQFPNANHVLLRLVSPVALPPITPGQFVEVRCDNTAAAMLRRPISIHRAEAEAGMVELLIHCVGAGTNTLAQLKVGDRLNCLLPLGRGFTLLGGGKRVLLVGGGVGSAPLLQLGIEQARLGNDVTFILGGKTASDILLKERYEEVGRLCITTEDGSLGTRGFVTQHDVIGQSYDIIQTCGPRPMMQAVARLAQERGTDCEVSLENLMACGMGACLCCVEKTTRGHVCVCTEGPVFNSRDLLWT